MSMKWSEQVRGIMCGRMLVAYFSTKYVNQTSLEIFRPILQLALCLVFFFQVLSLCCVYCQAMLVLNNLTFLAIENDMGHRSYTPNVLRLRFFLIAYDIKVYHDNVLRLSILRTAKNYQTQCSSQSHILYPTWV